MRKKRLSIMSTDEYDSPFYCLDLEGDYETIYKKGWRPDPYGEATIPVGLLTKMCSSEEMYEREMQKRLSKYETKPDTKPPRVDINLAIKEYRRSAAGRVCSQAILLRPWTVLQKTVHYLLLDICLREDDWMYICDFVFDRLKAVRQDMIIQRIEGMRYIEVLEASIRFLVYSMYKLTCTLNDYTLDQPFKVVLSPEGTPLTGLNNYEINVVREMKITMQSLRDCLQSLFVQYQDYYPESANRGLFEAIGLIVNLPFLPEYQFYQTDFLKSRESRNSNYVMKTVFKMYLEHLSGNHLAAMNLLPKLREYPLIILAYAPVIAQLQVHLMQVIKKAHGSRGPSKTQPDNLSKLLCPDWMDVSYDERLIYTIFMATQFQIYDDSEVMIDFCTANQNDLKFPRDFRERAEILRNKLLAQECEVESETRAYAMQLIAAKNWSFYSEVMKVYGIESVLNPSA